MALPSCRCSRTSLVLTEEGSTRYLCPVCGASIESCPCTSRDLGECACGSPTVRSLGRPYVYACRRCGQDPARCGCLPKEVRELQDEETFQHWMGGGDALAFSMQRVAERKWRAARPEPERPGNGGAPTEGG